MLIAQQAQLIVHLHVNFDSVRGAERIRADRTVLASLTTANVAVMPRARPLTC